MNTRTISQDTLQAIEQYEHFHIGKTEGSARCNIPYFNNKRTGLRAALPALVGKGSPKDIFEETEILALQEKVPVESFTGVSLKKFLIDHNIGIDCSGLAYFILNQESVARGKGTIDRHLSFPYAGGIIAKIAARIHPVKNADVRTFAHAKNSKVISLQDVQPGDIITMTGANESFNERDHILVIHKVDYQNFVPTTLYYINSVAWPTDGLEGHGVRQGKIEITDVARPLVDQLWTEKDATDAAHYTHVRAKVSTTELRRLKWFE